MRPVNYVDLAGLFVSLILVPRQETDGWVIEFFLGRFWCFLCQYFICIQSLPRRGLGWVVVTAQCEAVSSKKEEKEEVVEGGGEE